MEGGRRRGQSAKSSKATCAPRPGGRHGSAMARRGGRPTSGLSPVPPPGGDRVAPMLSGGIEIGPHHSLAIGVPLGSLEMLEILDHLKGVERAPVCALMNRLDLQEREVGVELDRVMDSRQADVGEKRTEPTIGFDDALVAFVSRMADQIGRRTEEKTPPRRSPCDEPSPDLHEPRFDER